MKNITASFLIVCFALVLSPNQAFSAKAKLSGRVSSNGKNLSIGIDAPRGLYCTGSLVVSTSSANPKAMIFSRALQLPLFSTNKIAITDLKKIRSVTRKTFSAFISSSLRCNDGRTYKNIKEIRIRSTSARSGFTSIARWVSSVKQKLNTEVEKLSAVPFPPSGISVTEAFSNLSFSAPIDLRDSGEDSNRLFVAEQGGRIYSFENLSSATDSKLFLNISERITSGGEQGLLGLAFHPNYKSNGYFYVNYTRKSDGATVVSRFSVSSDRLIADSASELILLIIAQPYENHNGGALQFGPDGYLYIALGDGGSGGDPQGNGQNLSALLGKILRINVDETSPGLNYSVPTTNPFFGNGSGYKEEIFAYGLRNPWRMSFDFATNRFWVADVGQGAHEEIDLVTSGGNYGWNTMEGYSCYASGSGCDQSGLILPVADYDHSQGQSVTGGYVYRGSAVPSLFGVYLYGDFVSGRIWGIRGLDPLENALLLDSEKNISSFGIDRSGEVYVLNYSDGKIYRFQGS